MGTTIGEMRASLSVGVTTSSWWALPTASFALARLAG